MIKLRNFLPKTLFGRAFIIIGLSIALLQGVITYIFFERHWEDVGRRLALALGGSIVSIIDQIHDTNADTEKIKIIFSRAERNHLMDLQYDPNLRLKDIQPHKLTSVLDHTLDHALAERIPYDFLFDTKSKPGKVTIYVSVFNGLLSATVARKTLYSSTTMIFIGWMIGTALLLLSVAVYFLHRQIKPLKRVAEAAEAFGRNGSFHDLIPRGSTEVRMVTKSFIEMRERIRSQIKQRTDMLTGVSHDLKTPLTRMHLQLALLKDKSAQKSLSHELEEMQIMIDDYLTFAREEKEEQIREIKLHEIILNIGEAFKKEGLKIVYGETLKINISLRLNAFKRSLNNLIANATLHAKTIKISTIKDTKNVYIIIDDDGPGIPKELREEAFKPFLRLDPSRNPESGGTGLGLTISREIARSHGGDVDLFDSPLGGLRAKIRLPL